MESSYLDDQAYLDGLGDAEWTVEAQFKQGVTFHELITLVDALRLYSYALAYAAFQGQTERVCKLTAHMMKTTNGIMLLAILTPEETAHCEVMQEADWLLIEQEKENTP